MGVHSSVFGEHFEMIFGDSLIIAEALGPHLLLNFGGIGSAVQSA